MTKTDDLPTQNEVENALLRLLWLRTAPLEARRAYDLLAEEFHLTSEQTHRVMDGVVKENHWHNRVRQARRRLVDTGYVDGTQRDRWTLTDRGREHNHLLDSLKFDI